MKEYPGITYAIIDNVLEITPTCYDIFTVYASAYDVYKETKIPVIRIIYEKTVVTIDKNGQ